MSVINNKLQHKPQNNTFKNQMAHLMHLTFPMRISVYMPPIQASYYLYKMYLFITVDNELFQVTSQHSLPAHHYRAICIKAFPWNMSSLLLNKYLYIAMFLPPLCLPTYYSSRALETKTNSSIATTPLRCQNPLGTGFAALENFCSSWQVTNKYDYQVPVIS